VPGKLRLLVIVSGEMGKFLFLTQERTQEWTYRGVFNRADLFKQKLNFILAVLGFELRASCLLGR
jgi:hypothetical protein